MVELERYPGAFEHYLPDDQLSRLYYDEPIPSAEERIDILEETIDELERKEADRSEILDDAIDELERRADHPVDEFGYSDIEDENFSDFESVSEFSMNLPMEDQANEEIKNNLINSFADRGFDAEFGVDVPFDSDEFHSRDIGNLAEVGSMELRERKMAEDILEDIKDDPRELKQGYIRVEEKTPRRYDDDDDHKHDDPSAPVDWGALGDAARRVGNVLRDAIDEKAEGKEVKIQEEDLRVLAEEKKFDPYTIEKKLDIEPFENKNVSSELIVNTVNGILTGANPSLASIRNNLDKIMRRAVNDIYKIENKNERIDKLQGLLKTMKIAETEILYEGKREDPNVSNEELFRLEEYNDDLLEIFKQVNKKWYPSIRHLDEIVDIKSMLEDPDVSPHLSNFDLSESKLTNDEIEQIRRAFADDLKWIDMGEGSFESKIEPLRDYINDNVKNDILREILLRDVENRFEAQLFRESNIHPRLYSTQPLDKYRNLELTSGILENLYDTVKLVSQKPQERPRQRINKDIIKRWFY